MLSNQSSLDKEINKELKELGKQIKQLDREPTIVYKPIKSVYLQDPIKYRKFQKTKLSVIEKEKLRIPSPEQTIRNTIENFIMREQNIDSHLSNYETTQHIVNLIDAGDVMTRENSQLMTDITNLPLCILDKSDSPSTRRIKRDESIDKCFKNTTQEVRSQSNYGVKVAQKLLN